MPLKARYTAKERKMPDADGDNGGFEVISPVFRNGSPIPPQYTQKGQNVNPPINIFNPPAGSQSLALIMHDPDAVSGDYTHWLVWDIPPRTEAISVNGVPVGAVQGANGSGQAVYAGPAPPAGSGTHRYIFDFYALDAPLNLPSGASREQLEKAMDGRVIGRASLSGTFAAD
jgi:Raf kinase inhibitor-like YbhB/YbcL family protein